MFNEDMPNLMANQLFGLEARHTTNGGFLANYVIYVVCYALFLVLPAIGHKDGIFANTGLLWFVQVFILLIVATCFAPGISAFIRVGLANAGLKYSIRPARIKNNSESSVDIVFNRRPLKSSNSSKSIEKLPRYLVDPEGFVGELKIDIDKRRLEIEQCFLGVVGFDRYQVTACDGLRDSPQFYVSVRIPKPTEVLLVGQFLNEGGSLKVAQGSKLVLIESSKFDDFMRCNMYRVLLLCSLFTLQLIIW